MVAEEADTRQYKECEVDPTLHLKPPNEIRRSGRNSETLNPTGKPYTLNDQMF